MVALPRRLLVGALLALATGIVSAGAAAAPAPSAPCSAWWLTEQNTYTSFPLHSVGMNVGAVSINDDYFAAGSGWSYSAFLGATEDEVYRGIKEYAGRYPRNGTNTTDMIVMDIESPVNPGNLSGYNATELLAVVKAIRLRVCITRQLFPNARIGLYGTVEGMWLPGSMKGLLTAAQLGLFDDIDFLVPVLYLGGGMNAAQHTETVLKASAQITTSQGVHLPLAPMLSWVYFGNDAKNDCSVSQSDITAVVNTIEQLKAQWAGDGSNITVPVVQLWSGSDDETSACSDHETQWQWLQKTKIVPDNCKTAAPPPLPPRRPPTGNFSNDTCLAYTQAGFVIEGIDPPDAANSGGTVLWITGRRFAPNATRAKCRFFMSREGATWGSEVAYEPFAEILVPTSDPVTNATVVNSTHAYCSVPPIVVPVGNTMNSPHENGTIRVGGPAMVDLSMDGAHYSGLNPLSPSNLQLYSPLSATFGRKPYIAASSGTVLYRVHPGAANGNASASFEITVSCGSVVIVNAAPVRVGSGVLPVSFAKMPASVSTTCTAELSASHGASGAMGGADTPVVETLELIRVAAASPVQTTVDYETRSIRLDGGQYLPFGYFTHEAGLAARNDQMYLTPLGINNFMHYMFEGYDTPVAVEDYVVLMDDVTQMGSWIQPDLASIDPGLAKDKPINWTALASIVSTLSSKPGMWAWYDSDDTITYNTTTIHQCKDFLRLNDPHHVISKAQASSSSAWAFQFLADVQMSEMYCERSPTCSLSSDVMMQYPMDWVPQGVCGDAGSAMGVGYSGPGTWPQALRTQWFSAMSQGAVINSLFIFLRFMPFVLVESVAESGLATFELAPSLHTSGVFAERPALQSTADVDSVVQSVWREPNGCILVMVVGASSEPAVNVTTTLLLGGQPIPGNLSGVKPVQGRLPVNLVDGAFTFDLHPFESEAFLFNCSQPSSDPKNPVINPSMEEYALPGFPVGWQVGGNTLARSRNISAFALSETRFAHSGRHSLRVSVPWDTFAATVLPIPGVKARKGAHYTVTAWGRVYVPTMCSPLRVVDAGGNTVGQPARLSVGSWAQVSMSGTATTDGPLGFACGSGGTFYLDDVAVDGAADGTVDADVSSNITSAQAAETTTRATGDGHTPQTDAKDSQAVLVTPDRTVYTPDDEMANLRIRLLPNMVGLAENARLMVECRGAAEPLASVAVSTSANRLSVPLRITELPWSGNSDLESAHCSVTISAKNNASVRVNPIRLLRTCARRTGSKDAGVAPSGAGLTVDGAPFISMGWIVTDTLWQSPNHTEYHLARLSSRAVNTAFLSELGPSSSINVTRQLHALNVSWAGGIQAVVAVASGVTSAELSSYIAAVKSHPALLGYYIDCASSPVSPAVQQTVFSTIKQHDPERLVFSLQPDPKTAAGASAHFDVLLVPAGTLPPPSSASPALRSLASKPTIAVGGHPLDGQGGLTMPPPFHNFAARSSRLSNDVYGALLGGCAGYTHAWYHPGTPYSLVNGVGEVALQVSELLPSFVSTVAPPTLTLGWSAPDTVGADPPSLVARGFKEPGGAVHVVVLNPRAAPVRGSWLNCSSSKPGDVVYAPFQMNRSFTLGGSGAVGQLTLLAQPLEVQVFRFAYPWASLASVRGNIVTDPKFEDYELYPGFPKMYHVNVFSDILFDDGRMSSGFGETRPGFVRAGSRHSFRITRPYTVLDEKRAVKCSLLVPFSGGVNNKTAWTVSFWHRTAPGVDAMGINTTIKVGGLGNGVFTPTPQWSQYINEFKCGVVVPGQKRPVSCTTELDIALPWGGQLWLSDLVVAPHNASDAAEAQPFARAGTTTDPTA